MLWNYVPINTPGVDVADLTMFEKRMGILLLAVALGGLGGHWISSLYPPVKRDLGPPNNSASEQIWQITAAGYDIPTVTNAKLRPVQQSISFWVKLTNINPVAKLELKEQTLIFRHDDRGRYSKIKERYSDRGVGAVLVLEQSQRDQTISPEEFQTLSPR